MVLDPREAQARQEGFSCHGRRVAQSQTLTQSKGAAMARPSHGARRHRPDAGIDRAYALLGYKAAGEALSADDADYGQALNAMLDGWNTQLCRLSWSVRSWAMCRASATVGPGLDFDTPRPVRVENGAFSASTASTTRCVDRPQNHAAIALKAVGSQFPQYAYY
jgi:hypothetical protein